MTDDVLAGLRRRLDELSDEPLGAHPGVLDDVHRALVAELDGLTGTVAGRPASSA